MQSKLFGASFDLCVCRASCQASAPSVSSRRLGFSADKRGVALRHLAEIDPLHKRSHGAASVCSRGRDAVLRCEAAERLLQDPPPIRSRPDQNLGSPTPNGTCCHKSRASLLASDDEQPVHHGVHRSRWLDGVGG